MSVLSRIADAVFDMLFGGRREVEVTSSFDRLAEFVSVHGAERVYATPAAARMIAEMLGVEVNVADGKVMLADGVPAAYVYEAPGGGFVITIVWG